MTSPFYGASFVLFKSPESEGLGDILSWPHFAWLIIKQCFLSDESPLCTTDPGEKWLGYEGVGEDEELLASGKAAPTPVNRRRAARQGRESSSEQKQEASKGGRESN